MLRNQYIKKRNSVRRQAGRSVVRAKVYEAGYSAAQARRGLAPRGFRPYTAKSVEKKCFDLYHMLVGAPGVGDTLVYEATNAGLVTPIFIPKLGADYDQRNGRKVTATSLYLKWRAFPHILSSLADAPFNDSNMQIVETWGRILIVHDTQPNGVLPAITDILLAETSTGFVDAVSFLNMDNRDRFKVLLDKYHQFCAFAVSQKEDGPTMNALGGSTTWTGKKYKRLNSEVIFNATSAGTIGDISSGALYLVLLGSEAAGNATVDFDVNTRVRYSDN